jgi:hypothetical protein
VGLVVGATAPVVGAIEPNGEAAVSGIVMLAIGGPSSALLWVQTRRESTGLRDSP